jgi:hypothetical protein
MHTLTFLLVLITSTCFAQQQEAVEKLLLGYEQALMNGVGLGDKALWNKHLHDSCVISIETGEATTKQKMVNELNPLPAGYIGRIEVIEPRVQVYENTAVVSFIADEYLELFHQKIHTQYRQTDTWINLGNEWKIISMQLFEIPKNPLPVEVSENVLKQYIGSYTLSPERKCSVYVEEGKLYAKKGNDSALELIPETESVFFRKGDGRVNVIFIKNGQGGYRMVERREGEDLVWTNAKIK